MQATSATFDRILAGTDHIYETRLIIDGVGTFGESDIMSISTNIEMFQEDPEVGKAIASEINVVMFNPSATIPTMAKLQPQVRACGNAPKSSKVTITDEDLASTYATYSSENITFSSSSGATVAGENLSFSADTTEYLESEWLSQGIFYVDTRDVTQNNNGLDVLTMHGFDAMLKTEQIYSSNASVGNNLDIAYVRAIASAIGVTVDPRTWEIMQTGYMIPFPLSYTMREILGYIASTYAGCFIINDVGQLRLVALEDIESETRYLIDEIGNIIVFGVDSPQHTVTASGAIATFTAGGEYPLDELEIAIDPVQDLHGYDSPYPAGGGKNKTSTSTISLTSDTPTVVAVENDSTANKTWAFSFKLSNANATNASGTFVSFINENNSSRNLPVQYLRRTSDNTAWGSLTKPVTDRFWFNYSESSYGKLASIKVYYDSFADGRWSGNDITELMLEVANSPSEYADYSNICPISGWTGMDINNAPIVLSLEQGGLYDANGGEAGNANRIRTDFIPISALSKGTNIIDLIQSDNVDVRKRYFYWYDANKTYIHEANGTFNQAFPVELKRSIIPDGAEYLRLVLQNYDNSLPILPDDYKVSINTTTISISWQTEAGTVYKGTLNVLTGVLTATMAKSNLYGNGISVTRVNTSQTNIYRFQITGISGIFEPSSTSAVTTAISNAYKSISADSTYLARENGISVRNSTTIHIYDENHNTDVGTNFKSYLEQNDAYVVYPLATPLTFQLTPTQVKTLLDHNNLWANTGDVNSLSFVEPATEAVRILV